MLREKLTIERKEAVRLTVDFSGTTEEYAMAWSKLTNNAREHKRIIWKIENSLCNEVYVICHPDYVDVIKALCTDIVCLYRNDENRIHCVGRVIDEEEIVVGVPLYECESTCRTSDPQWEMDIDSAITDWIDVLDG